jgi:hypothetical protein
MPTTHRYSPASEIHRLPAFEFASLGAATANVYDAADASYMVRVGTSPGPYTYYIITQVTAGVATLVQVGGSSFPGYGSHVDLTVGGAGANGVATTVARSDHEHGLPAFGTGSGTIAEGSHTHAGLGSGYFDVWDPDAPPVSAHSQNDECDGSSVAGSWATFDPHSGTVPMTVTASATRGYYQFTRAITNPTSIWGGLYKAIPSGSEWSITGKFSYDMINGTPTGRLTGIGLALYENPAGAPTTSNLDLLMIGPSSTAPYSVWKGTPTQYNNFPAVTNQDAQAYYLRIRKGTVSSGFDFSPDGYTWHQLTNSVQAYGYWGPVCYSWSQLRARCHWLRVQEASGVSVFETCPPLDGASVRRLRTP